MSSVLGLEISLDSLALNFSSIDYSPMTTCSILIPVRNRHHLLAQLLDQLLLQARASPHPCEIVVVDDGSEPPIRLPANSCRFIKLIRQDVPRGPQAARRLALSVASGDIIHFHDSDDLVCDGWLDQIIDAFVSDPGFGMLITARFRQERAGGRQVLVTPEIAVRLARSPRWFSHYQHFRNAIGPIGGVTFRREHVRCQDLVDVPASQDWLLYDAVLSRRPKIAVRTDIRFVSRAFDHERISTGSRRRVKGFVAASHKRFKQPWARRAAAILYCANAGGAVDETVCVRHAAAWRFVGARIAESRLLALIRQYRGRRS